MRPTLYLYHTVIDLIGFFCFECSSTPKHNSIINNIVNEIVQKVQSLEGSYDSQDAYSLLITSAKTLCNFFNPHLNSDLSSPLNLEVSRIKFKNIVFFLLTCDMGVVYFTYSRH